MHVSLTYGFLPAPPAAPSPAPPPAPHPAPPLAPAPLTSPSPPILVLFGISMCSSLPSPSPILPSSNEIPSFQSVLK